MKIERQLDVEDDAVFDLIVSRLGFEKIAEDVDVDHEILRGYEYRVPEDIPWIRRRRGEAC